MLQLVCVEHGCWKDMTRQGKSGAAIFHHGTEAKSISLNKKRNMKQKHQRSRDKPPQRDGKEILVLLLHEIQLNAPSLGPKRNPVFSTNVPILN